jgi:hypothetical protein
MDNKIIQKYRSNRREHPFMPAKHALSWAKRPDAQDAWEPGGGHEDTWTKEVGGLTILLRVESESIFPIPNRHGDTDYGSYVDEVGIDYNYDWRGNWREPAEHAPLGLPYTAIRYSGPGWVQGDMEGGYFIPDGIEEEYKSYRSMGQSKSVAWELTRKFVEDQLKMLFVSPLTNMVVHVTALSEGIELAHTCMGTDVSGDEEGRAYIFEMVEEHGMVDEVVEEAQVEIKRLAALA